MKLVGFLLVFACLIFPVFSQDPGMERFTTLDSSLSATISDGNTKLSNFDQLISDNDHAKSYAVYRERYESLSRALQESEFRLTRLIQFNDRIANVKAERNNYQDIIHKLEAVKTEYSDWLRTVQ